MDSSGIPIADFSGEKDSNNRKCSIPCRYLLSILGCLGFAVVYALRVNLSVALVAMVNSTSSPSGSYKSSYFDEGIKLQDSPKVRKGLFILTTHINLCCFLYVLIADR